MTKLEKKQTRSIEFRIRRLEMALRFRTKKCEIKPKKRFLQNFPRLEGRTFWLVDWVDDKRIKVLVSGTKNPHYYAASFFIL